MIPRTVILVFPLHLLIQLKVLAMDELTQTMDRE